LPIITEEVHDAAIEALRARGGQEFWHIFVARQEGVGVIRVQGLHALLSKLGAKLFELTFGDLEAHIPAARQVQQDAIGIGTAERLAPRSPARALVVKRGEKAVGRFYAPFRGAEDVFPGSTMGQLYGDYISQAPDARATWRPSGVAPPVCPHCGHVGFFRYRASDKTFYCSNCSETIP
jgi:hypothetical protein